MSFNRSANSLDLPRLCGKCLGLLSLWICLGACESHLAACLPSPEVVALRAWLEATGLKSEEMVVFASETELLSGHDGRGVVVSEGRVEHLVVWNAQLRELPPVERLPHLRSLDMFGNQLQTLPDLSGWNSLERLSLRSNRIALAKPLGVLPQLRELRLDYNDLTAIDGFQLEHAPGLTFLSLEGNRLQSCEGLGELKALRELLLSVNQLASLECLHGTSQLEWLRASDNQLRELAPLRGLTRLKELDVDHNALTSVAGLEALPQLLRVSVRENPSLDPGDQSLRKILETLVRRQVALRHDLLLPESKGNRRR